MRHGTKLLGTVTDINTKGSKYEIVVTAQRTNSCNVWTIVVKEVPSKVRIGSTVDVFVDDRDADGEYFIKLL